MQPLDLVSRFDPPDFAHGEEQRLVDRENKISELEDEIARICLRWRSQWWGEHEWATAAHKMLLEFGIDAEMRNMPDGSVPKLVWDAYSAVEQALRLIRDKEARDATD